LRAREDELVKALIGEKSHWENVRFHSAKLVKDLGGFFTEGECCCEESQDIAAK